MSINDNNANTNNNNKNYIYRICNNNKIIIYILKIIKKIIRGRGGDILPFPTRDPFCVLGLTSILRQTGDSPFQLGRKPRNPTLLGFLPTLEYYLKHIILNQRVIQGACQSSEMYGLFYSSLERGKNNRH